MLPFPQFTSVTTDVPPTANSTYHGLQVVFEKRYSNGLELSANYTWSKSIDDASLYDTNVTWLGSYGPNSGFALQDPNKPYLERSLSTFDVPQQAKINYTYELPFGRGKAFLNTAPRAVDLVLGGWKTAGVWSLRNGFPLQFTVENGGSPIWSYGPQRPNIVGTPRRRDTLDKQHSDARHDTAPMAQFTLITSPVVSFNSTTAPFCGLLWLKSSMLLSVPAMLSNEPLPIRLPPRNASSINRMIDV
jgi:hypothetical protein